MSVHTQGPSASAYVTYINNNDALRAIQSVNNIMIDGRLIKTSLGTTKYCSHFMKNQTCPKPDCMYLHELGDQEASFTKEVSVGWATGLLTLARAAMLIV